MPVCVLTFEILRRILLSVGTYDIASDAFVLKSSFFVFYV